MDSSVALLAAAVGANAREFRSNAGLTLDQVARAAGARGLKWTESRVADFEAGRVMSPSINTLLAVVLAMNDAGCKDVTLPGLFRSVKRIAVNDALTMDGGEIVNLMAGLRVTPALEADDVAIPNLRRNWTSYERKVLRAFPIDVKIHNAVARAQGTAESRISSSVKIDPLVLAAVTATLWGSTFTAERNRRAGDDANAQRRGQVSRAMQAELKDAIRKAIRSRP